MVQGTLHLETTSTKIKEQHAFNIVQVLFYRWNVHCRWNIKIMSDFYFVCQEILVETNHLAVIASSFLKFEIVARNASEARTNSFLEVRLSRAGCNEYLIYTFVKAFFSVKRYLVVSQFFLRTAAANYLNLFLLRLKKFIDNHNHYRQNRKQESVVEWLESY